MGFLTNLANGAINYNRAVEEAGRSRTATGSYMRNFIKPAETAAVIAVMAAGLAGTILTLINYCDGNWCVGDVRNNATRENNSGLRYKHQ